MNHSGASFLNQKQVKILTSSYLSMVSSHHHLSASNVTLCSQVSESLNSNFQSLGFSTFPSCMVFNKAYLRVCVCVCTQYPCILLQERAELIRNIICCKTLGSSRQGLIASGWEVKANNYLSMAHITLWILVIFLSDKPLLEKLQISVVIISWLLVIWSCRAIRNGCSIARCVM